MYAQLCRRLCEEAPGPIKTEPCTFRNTLLSVCKDQFDNRSKRSSDKRKSLGNIKFIGELCKLGIIKKPILYSCMKTLLDHKRSSEMAEDLECICQILRTCGQILDNEEAHVLMDQMFNRMSGLTTNMKLPLRIRFMLRDIIELRAEGWVPRKASNVEGPLPINQLCDDGSPTFRSASERPPQQELFPRSLKTRSSGLDNIISGGLSFPQHDKFPTYNSNGFHSFTSRERGNQRHNHHQQNNSHYYQQNRYNNHHHNNNNNSNNVSNSKDVPPRFIKKIAETSANLEQVSLRPAANSMLIKPPNTKQISSHLYLGRNSLTDPLSQTTLKPTPPIQTTKEVPILIKQASAERNKPTKKEKAATKEETLRKASAIAEEVCSGTNIDEAAANFAQVIKLQERLIPECLTSILSLACQKTDAEREIILTFVTTLKKNSTISHSQFHDAFRSVVKTIPDQISTVPNIQEIVAGIASIGISENCLTIAQVSELTEDAAHFPLLLQMLSNLNEKLGKEKLSNLFRDSKVNLMNCLSSSERTKARLNEVLKERGLNFLEPLLELETELWVALEQDPTAQSLYKRVKETVSPELQMTPAFITALVTVSLRHITKESTNGEGITSITIHDKPLQEKEKALLENFKPVLQAFLHKDINLQVTAVYSLQTFCDSYNFPKGMLLRWFMNLYDLEIIEEEAYLKWKEDINSSYPGKGRALFQVNQWLTWLEEAESEEEEEENGDN